MNKAATATMPVLTINDGVAVYMYLRLLGNIDRQTAILEYVIKI